MTELRKLGRYEIIREIGRGGMSTVYLAHDPVFEREVALKLLPRAFLHDPTFKARFEREAKSIAKIEHAAIVPVYDFGEEEGQPFLVMRHMTGGTLGDQLEQGPLSIEDAERIIARLASALTEAHERGMIHRDIKPKNVLFDHHGDAFLTDFGIVKLTQETTTYTGSGIIGTPAYMSPEQARGDRDIDARSDVYALGAILFEMLTGRPPYESETVMGLAIKHITEPIPSILALKPDLPPALEELIRTAMCKERDGRYASVEELAEALRESITKAPETIVEKPSPPETLVSKPEIEPTVIERPKDREEIIVPETIQEVVPSVIEKKSIRIPIWAWGAGGIVIVAVVLAIMFPKLGVFKPTPTSTSLPTPLPSVTPIPPATPEPTLPPITGQDPSPLVAAFYYPWYGNPDRDEGWFHWEGEGLNPPTDISSNYYPLLGTYSSFDPAVIAQHYAWLRYAGVGIIISSWWGQGSYEDGAVPLLLEMGERYGIKVAFHIEPYKGRSAAQLLADVQYLYDRYGEHSAFFRTSASSRWSPDNREKGLFFLWDVYEPQGEVGQVEPEYWQDAIDAIHKLPQGGIIIAHTTEVGWIDGGHFDGIYNDVSHDLDFNWAKDIPMDAWYVPSVMPGFFAERIDYPVDTILDRAQGETYQAQWQAAFDIGVQPQMVTITSFNEWREGTQIEPATPGFTTDQGFEYLDYRPLEPEAYLMMTRERVDQFRTLEKPPTYRARIHITSSSDWTIFILIEGGLMIRPNILEVSDEAREVGLSEGNLNLRQEYERAEVGGEVELILDLLFSKIDPDSKLVFRIERGNFGMTVVELMNYVGEEPVLVETFRWGGIINKPGNPMEFEIPASLLIEPPS